MELNVGWCEHLSDASLTALAAKCPRLKELDLCGCVRVSRAELMRQTAISMRMLGWRVVCVLPVNNYDLIIWAGERPGKVNDSMAMADAVVNVLIHIIMILVHMVSVCSQVLRLAASQSTWN